jgi:hypothetical protein
MSDINKSIDTAFAIASWASLVAVAFMWLAGAI